MSKEKTDNDRWIIWVAFAVTVIIIGLWFLTIYLLKGDEDRGTFGDMFGSINALFSGLAMAGIILTILLQRKELKLQREELRDTRGEFVKQNEGLRLQRFENTFFSMISIHLEMIESLKSTNLSLKGRDTFKESLGIFSQQLSGNGILNYNKNDFPRYQELFRNHNVFYLNIFSHYLQSLAAIYNHIRFNLSDKTGEQKAYFLLLKSYISAPERAFLFYFLILGESLEITNSTLLEMEQEIDIIGSVSKSDLLSPSHLKLIENYK